MTIDVIIPVLNEEQSIGMVLHALADMPVRKVYVCDNGSIDRTADIAREKGAEVVNEPRKGYGSACLRGLREISKNSLPDVVVFIDGDFSDDPSEMLLLIRKLDEEKLDLVLGSRVLGNPEPGSLTSVQIFGNALATFLIRLFWGYRFTDLGPFRAIRYSSLLKLKMEDPDYGWTVEMQIKAAKYKMRCSEIPVSYRKRIGKSKVSGTMKGVLGAGSKILYIIFKTFVKG